MVKTAMIGAGQMGGRLARRVMGGGHAMMICDLSPGVREAFAKEGATIAESPAACAAADVVMICVMNGPQTVEVVTGPNGLLSGIDPARPPLVVIMGTILPDDVRKAAKALATKGVHVVDAPVTGGLLAASEGKMTILTGGREEDITAIEPLLQLMGRTILRCGPLGAGETAKIINNLVGTANMYIAFESYRLGMANGMNPEYVAHLLQNGTGYTFWHQNPDTALGHYDVLTRDPAYFSTVLDATAKDWKLALSLAEEAGLHLPFVEALTKCVGEVNDGSLFADWRAFTQEQQERTSHAEAAAR